MINEDEIEKNLRILEKFENKINLKPYTNNIDNLYTTINFPSKKDKLLLRIAIFAKNKDIKLLYSCNGRINECFKRITTEAAKNYIKKHPYLPHKNLTLKKLFGIPSENKKKHKKFQIKKYTLAAIEQDQNTGIDELNMLEYLIKEYGEQTQNATAQLLNSIQLAKEKYYLNFYLRQKGNHTNKELQQAKNILLDYFPNTTVRIPTEEDLLKTKRTPDLLIEKQGKMIFVELKVWNELTPHQDLKLLEQVISYALLSKTCILLITLKNKGLTPYFGEYNITSFIKKVRKRIQELNRKKEDIIKTEREYQRETSKQILQTWINKDEELYSEIDPAIMEMQLLTLIHGVANEELGIIQNQIMNGNKLLTLLKDKKNKKIKLVRLEKPIDLNSIISETNYTIGIIEEPIEQEIIP